MRDVPDHVAKAIRARDPLASVKWDDASHVWVLDLDGGRICQLFHVDGTDMLELCVDEILDIMGRYDNTNDGPERIARMRRSAANARAKAEERKQQLVEESMRESSQVTDVLLNGVSPQYHVTNNPLYKEKVQC